MICPDLSQPPKDPLDKKLSSKLVDSIESMMEYIMAITIIILREGMVRMDIKILEIICLWIVTNPNKTIQILSFHLQIPQTPSFQVEEVVQVATCSITMEEEEVILS